MPTTRLEDSDDIGEPSGLLCPRCGKPLIFDLDDDVFDCEACGFSDGPKEPDWFDEVKGG